METGKSSFVVQLYIIVVTETWLTEISSFSHMSGHQCINLFRSRHDGGICVYCDKNIKIEVCSEGTVVFDLVMVILCNLINLFEVIHRSCFFIGLHMKTRYFIEFLNNMFQRIKHSYPYIGDCVKTEHFAEYDPKEEAVED